MAGQPAQKRRKTGKSLDTGIATDLDGNSTVVLLKEIQSCIGELVEDSGLSSDQDSSGLRVMLIPCSVQF